MDSVRFGRALGVGVREAAKAAVKAAEAAAAPDPDPKQANPQAAPQAAVKMPPPPGSSANRSRTAGAVKQSVQTAQGLKEGGRRFGQATLAPVKKAGGVLWHEVMGVLFGLFVLVAAEEAWRGRNSFAVGPGRTHEWLALGMLVVFGFFMVSSFVKARRRSRR